MRRSPGGPRCRRSPLSCTRETEAVDPLPVSGLRRHAAACAGAALCPPAQSHRLTGPLLGGPRRTVGHDLTAQPRQPQGQRIIVHGRVLDGDGRPVRNTLIEVWQANAGGRYRHDRDRHPSPIDPNFSGGGRCLTDDEGRYRFITIQPGAYPWPNHENAWRAAHIHFSLFGNAFPQRLVTQMFFPGDVLFFQDPIFNAIPDQRGRDALVSRFDLSETVPEWALAFEWNIVLRGRDATPTEDEDDGG